MLCSKCKILSVHVPNFDSYLCEFGHVLCPSCSPIPENQCGICNGRIIRRAEVLVEGFPKTVFRRTAMASYEPSGNDVWRDDGRKTFSQSEGEWSNFIDLNDLKDVDSNQSEASSLANVLDFKETGYREYPNYYSNLKSKRSACHFRTASKESIKIQEAIDSHDDPKDIYLKTLKGNYTSNFEPMKDYYRHTAHADTIHEYYKRPNLLTSTTSSKIGLTDESSDSSTVIQHLTEFRKATNYVPPANVSAYKVNDQNTRKPAIITTSKPQVNGKLQSRAETTETQHVNNKATSELKFIKPEPENIENTSKLDDTQENNRNRVNSAQHAILREQLRHQIYSQFETGSKPAINVFMEKNTSNNWQRNPPPNSGARELSSKANNVAIFSNSGMQTSTLNIPLVSNSNNLSREGSNKRDAIVKQSKEILRKRLMEEVYSQFQNSINVAQNGEQTDDSKIPSTTSEQSKKAESKDKLKTIYSNNMQEAQKVLPSTESKSIAMSTESYPKLNSDLIVIFPREYSSNNVISDSGNPKPRQMEISQDNKLSSIEETSVHTSTQKSGNLEETPKNEVQEENCPLPPVNSEIGEGWQERLEAGMIEKDPTHYPNDMNVYYYHESPPYPFTAPLITPENFNSLGMPKNIVRQFENPPDGSHKPELLDVNKLFIHLKQVFPNMDLNQLKDIIKNMPLDERHEKENKDLETFNPPTFRSDPESLIPLLSPTTLVESEVSEHPADLIIDSTTTSFRAHFYPPNDVYSHPSPQMKPIDRFEISTMSDTSPRCIRPATELDIPRSPIICPVTACRKSIFVSEISKHIKLDHVKVPIETLTPGKCKNIFLDPRNNDFGINKCHVLYLITDKIRDLGSKEFKDFLPILVMATKVNFLQLISPLCTSVADHQDRTRNYLMIWLTGLRPNDLPVYFSLTAWNRYSTKPNCHVVHAGEIYSIREKHDEMSVFNSGNALLLSQNQVHWLTNDGKNMMELQVAVH